jgi:ornithine cyclodeaminase/alanine dehydrogenase
MVLLLSEADVARTMSMRDAIDQLERAFRQHAAGSAIVTPRTGATIPGEGGMFRVMSAILPEEGFFGLKTLTGYPGRRRPGETYFVVLLFGCDHGALRAVIAGNRLTGMRTGAATGLAAKYMARRDARTLGVFGGGVQGFYQIAALNEVRKLEDVRIFDIEQDKAGRFARQVADDLGLKARAVGEPREAVAGCDLVVTATAAKAPVFDGGWLEPGTHVSGIGANSPAKRELDHATFARSRIVVDFKDQVLDEAGDLQDALKSGAISESSIQAELADLVVDRKRGRTNDQEITLFKSVGMAIEDIAVATFLYEQAAAKGIGQRLALEEASS